MFGRKLFNVDWVLFFSFVPIMAAGLITMRVLGNRSDYFFSRQLIWVFVGLTIFFLLSFFDWRFLRNGKVLLAVFLFLVGVLVVMLVVGKTVKGAASWIQLPFFSVEPAEFMKLVFILVLAKYFSRRHIAIANVRHIVVSAIYLALAAGPVFLQPDFGSALVLGLIWFGMIMVSGINKRHLFLVFAVAIVSFSICWLYVFKPYQKARIVSFLDPIKNARTSGYNAVQSVVAVGSGRIFGKGIGYGTQSRLEFLPEHQTDFIFAAFSEEWGFVGAVLIFLFYGLVIWRILKNSFVGETNFERLFGMGVVMFLMAHFILHVGMNIGLLPITGVGLPFMSYGGSNLIVIFIGLGILMGMRRYAREIHPEDAGKEFLGGR